VSTRYLAIVNPRAGGGRCGTRFPQILERLRTSGLDVEVVETRCPGDATTLARGCYADGWRRFLSVGGDGRNFEVVGGLLSAAKDDDAPPALGLLPLGTGDSFCRDFSDEGIEYSVRALSEGRSRACDVIRVTHAGGIHYCLNLVSVGFVAEVCRLANARFKRLGEAGYTASVLLKLARLRPESFPMRLDGGPEDREPLSLVSFCNSRFTGGTMMMAPDADPCDGQGDMVRLDAGGRRALVSAFRKIFKGTHVELPRVQTARFREVEFALDREVPVMIDGEVFDLKLERLDVVPGALELLL
jgi:diacylglycerol kinase (ATP)